jgi:transcription factor TGA
MYNKGIASLPLGNCHVENWADSGMADNSQQTDDTSTDIDTDDKNQVSSINFSNMFYFFRSLDYYTIQS